MSPGELRFIEPFLDKTCIMCASKGKYRRVGKNLGCQCGAVYTIMPDGSLAVFQRPPATAASAA